MQCKEILDDDASLETCHSVLVLKVTVSVLVLYLTCHSFKTASAVVIFSFGVTRSKIKVTAMLLFWHSSRFC